MRLVTPSVREFRSFCETTRISPVWLALGVGERSDRFSFSDTPLSDRIIKLKGNKTVSEFARVLRLPRTTVNSYLKGINGTKLDALIIIAANTDCSFSWLLTGIGAERPFEGLDSAPDNSQQQTANRSSLAAHISTATDSDDEARLDDFKVLIDTVLDRREQRLTGWLRTELDLVRDRLEERWPQVVHSHPSVKGGVA